MFKGLRLYNHVILQNSAAQLVLFVLGLLGTAVLLTSTAVGSSMQSTINSSMVNIILYYPVHDWANGKLGMIQESVSVEHMHIILLKHEW